MSEVKNKKIMVVDDNEFSRVLIQVKLQRSGYDNISMPETSIEAWDWIANAQLTDFPYDLVITDLNMPGLDGMDLISKIKEDPFSQDIKVIVVSADAEKAIIEITKTLGASAYLTKPFVTEEMLAVVEAVLKDEPIPEIKGFFSKENDQ